MRCTGIISPGGQCQQDSAYVIIYGCFDYHIRERPMCQIHTDEWMNMFNNRKWRCTDCMLKVEETILLLQKFVAVEYLNI